METALRALLIAGLPAMSAGRINWGEHPRDEARPYIVLHLVSLTEGHTMQGPDGLERSRVQIDCYAPSFGQAREIAGDVKRVLDHYREGQFRGVFFDAARTTRESGEDNAPLYRCSLDFIVNWRDDNA